MAACNRTSGYQCEFVDSVNDFFYCKKCSLVARQLTISTCCGESFCHACINGVSQQGGPCPECGEKMGILEQLKFQKKISALQVYCNMKERGCGWSGTLEQLDTHLDPQHDNCQYVDTKCPLNCQQTIPKNKLEEHMTQVCPKREYVCQHCAFKATYEEVMEKHLPECRYVAVSCSNLCGVTCDREDMEDHMRICRLEEVRCSFCDVGCSEKLPREQEEKHAVENVTRHLALTATNCIKNKEDLQKKLQEQELMLSSLSDQLRDQEQQIRSLKLDNKSLKQEMMDQIRAQERKFIRLFDHFSSLEQLRSFKITNFTFNMQKGQLWKSAVMYTHGGYKFFIGLKKVDLQAVFLGNNYSSFAGAVASATGLRISSAGTATGAKILPSASFSSGSSYIEIGANAIPGEYDESLHWPVSIDVTVEVIGPRSDKKSMDCTFNIDWRKPRTSYDEIHDMTRGTRLSSLSKLKEFIQNDTLFVRITNIALKER